MSPLSCPSEISVKIQNCSGLLANLESRVAVILTHPWGPLGGCMHDSVITTLSRFFQQYAHMTTLRFDFAGSQIGSGSYQVQQVCDAAKYLREDISNPPQFLLLIGYSYGSLIAASASTQIPNCIGCISLAPPWAVQHWLLMFHSSFHFEHSRLTRNFPRLYVMGDCDNFTSEATFRKTVDMIPNSTCEVLKNCNHFFTGRKKELLIIIQAWLLSSYKEAEGQLSSLGQADLSRY
jgi:uncharacterized protein